LCKLSSENGHGCTQNAENCIAFVDLLEQYGRDGDEFLNHITGDENCVSFVNVGTKEQSKQ
jgi:hypothetical protein